ncbi:MAG: DMT family transporter [Acetobacteraceae bacterium]|nr:DMT family transporter [Acetobacteraceae bacterium]
MAVLTAALLADVAALLALGMIWGLTPAVAKLLVQSGAGPLALAALVAALSCALLWLVCLLRRLRVPFDRAHLAHYAIAGGIGFALANLVAFTALRHVPAGLVAMIVPLSPILTVGLAAAVGMERATWRRLAGTALGLAGTALAISPGAALPEARLVPWALLLLAVPACYALTNVMAVRLAPRGTPPLALATGTLAVAAMTAGVAAMALGHAVPDPMAMVRGVPVAALLAAQAGLTALAYIIYFRLLAGVGGVVTSQVGYIVTVSGLLWGFLLFAEVPGWLTIPAAALIFAGLALVTLPARR